MKKGSRRRSSLQKSTRGRSQYGTNQLLSSSGDLPLYAAMGRSNGLAGHTVCGPSNYLTTKSQASHGVSSCLGFSPWSSLKPETNGLTTQSKAGWGPSVPYLVLHLYGAWSMERVWSTSSCRAPRLLTFHHVLYTDPSAHSCRTSRDVCGHQACPRCWV